MFISKRSNGIYYIHYFNSDEKRTCISTKARIKSDALKFLSDFQNELNRKKIAGVITKTTNEFLFEFVRYSESFHRPKTTNRFKGILKEFASYCGNIQLAQITKQMVESYLQQKTKVSLYTAQQHLAYLRSAFNKAVADRLEQVRGFYSGGNIIKTENNFKTNLKRWSEAKIRNCFLVFDDYVHCLG